MISRIVMLFHPGIDVIAALDLPIVDVRHVALGLQLLGDPKRPVAITARIAEEYVRHAHVLASLSLWRQSRRRIVWQSAKRDASIHGQSWALCLCREV